MIDYSLEIGAYLKKLFPIARSITGRGNRETFDILREIVPIDVHEYRTGQKVYDWVIPKEWSIKDAWVKDRDGNRIVDFQKNNLHVMSYSIPVRKTVGYDELRSHLHFLKDLPRAIPYRTSYYKEDWGFCISYEDFLRYFKKGEQYDICIDSDLRDGHLTIGECLIAGRKKKEYLISTYICHPSLANDNLSGAIMTAFLAREIAARKPEFSYRIVFVPETIGAITYCAMNEDRMKEIDTGLVVTCVGGPGRFGYKRSFDATHFLNGLIESVFKEENVDFIAYPFDVHGSDERQYASQAFRINTATISKDKYYEYEYYHTSFDDLAFVSADAINASLNIYLKVIERMDANVYFKNRQPACEAMLSKRGLYPMLGGSLSGATDASRQLDAILNLLFYSDGKTPLCTIAQRSGHKIEELQGVVPVLMTHGLLEEAGDE